MFKYTDSDLDHDENNDNDNDKSSVVQKISNLSS